MTLVDTSSWIHALRKSGDPSVRAKVIGLLEDGQVAWCDVVRLELRQGAVVKKEIRFLDDLEQDIPLLPMTTDVWNLACEVAAKLRKTGKTLPLTDVMIHACAKTHKVALEHADKHFDTLATL